MKPLSEHKRINQLLRNEFVSQRISAVKRASLKAKLSIARLTWPTENSQPTSSCSKTPRNHYRKTYATTRWFKTSLSHNPSQVSPEHVSKRSSLLRGWPGQLKQANQQFLARKRERMKPLSEHKRINQLLRNEFVSELISAVNRAYIQAKLSISKLTRPKENNQPRLLARRLQGTIIEKHTQQLGDSKRVCLTIHHRFHLSTCLNEVHYCEGNLANWNKPTNNFSLENANEWNHYRNTSE